jgi:hypothetical protein
VASSRLRLLPWTGELAGGTPEPDRQLLDGRGNGAGIVHAASAAIWAAAGAMGYSSWVRFRCSHRMLQRRGFVKCPNAWAR